jgi:hypothetical protein
MLKNYSYENLKEMLISNGYWYKDEEEFIEISYNNSLVIIVYQDLNIIAYCKHNEYFEDIENYSTKETFNNIVNIISNF